MHFGAQLLQLLLVRDAEMLLFVHDQQAEILELHALAEQRMRADHDIDLAVGQRLLGLREIGLRHEPRGLPDLHREAAEAFGEGLEMLARQQRGRHHDRDLLAVHGRDEGRAQRHFGLAEADIAADQPVHRTPGFEIADHGVDRGLLVVGLLVGEAGAEFVEDAGRDGELRRRAQQPLGRDLEELMRDLADAALHARLARLPAGAAEPVEIDLRFLRAVARQQFDILHRQEQLVAAGIVDFEAIMRRAGRLDGLQADETPDAVIDMHDKIAGGEARRFGDEILRAARGLARPHQAVAENVLLADDRGVAASRSRIRDRARQARCRASASAATSGHERTLRRLGNL